MNKIKIKATYGGYKQVAQYGTSEDEWANYYKNYGIQNAPSPQFKAPAQPSIIPVANMQVPKSATAPIPQTQQDQAPSEGGNGIIGALSTGVDWYNKFIQGKRDLANNINNGITAAAGVASIFTNMQLKRDENQQKIQSLQGASYDNSNRGTNNIPAYTKYGGNGKTNVEAEQGEVFDNGQDILKIDDNAASHEQGGVDIQAERVLENTSTKRKDSMSKALKLDKDTVTELSGFKAKRAMSHADAYEFEAKQHSKQQEKLLNAISKVVKNKNPDKYAIEAGKLNADLGLAQMPSENQIFDKYFENQESIKESSGFYDDEKAKYGKAEDGYINPYRKGKSKSPTGKDTNFPGTDADWEGYRTVWQDNLGKQYTDDYGGTYDLQYDSYSWALENNPQAIRNMWKTYGLNTKAKQNGVKYDTNNLTDEQLKDLRTQYVDGLSGARMLQPSFDNERIGPVDPLKPRQASQIPSGTIPTTENHSAADLTKPIVPGTTPTTVATKTPEEFNQPLEWYDTIGPAAQILSGLRRDPELYNPMNISQLKLQQQDVRPALNNSQSEYQSAIQNLGNDSIGAAQRAQIFSNKLRQDNQVIGQYENQNKNIQNQETQYNTQARDRQEAANAQSRESFYTKVLQGRAKQEEQLLTGIDAMAKTFAENRAFNRNANLIMKLAPNFDAKGNYNGVPVKFASSGSKEPGFATTNGNQPQVNEKGQYLLRTRNKDGKITEEYVDKSYYDKVTGTASSKAVENKLIMDMIGGRKK